MLALVCEPGQNLHCPVLDGWVRYSTGMDDSGGCLSAVRNSGPDRAE